MDVEWPALVFSESFEQRINALVRKKFVLDEAAAQEAVTYTINGLSADNWSKCRNFKGNSAPETFLYAISLRLINDYSRKLYGRPRPPAWLKRKGPLWVDIWRDLCLERAPIDVLLEKYTSNGLKDRELIEQVIRAIKCKLPWCGVSDAPLSLDDNNSESIIRCKSDNSHSTSLCPLDKLLLDDALELANLLLGNADDQVADAAALASKSDVYAIVTSITLTPEEKLVLKMHFCDALSFSTIAKHLHVAKHHPGRLIQSLLARVREQLKQSGIELDQDDFE